MPRGSTNWVHLDVVKVLKETDAAFLLKIRPEEDDEERGTVVEWIPKSQCDDPDAYGEGDEDVTISISEWLADQKGL